MRVGIIASMLSGLAASLNRFQERRVLKQTGRMLSRVAQHNPRVRRLVRGGLMRIGPPALKGKRLARVSTSCCPANLLVQPRYRADNACHCSKLHTDIPDYAATRSRNNWIGEQFRRAPANCFIAVKTAPGGSHPDIILLPSA